VVWLVYAGQPDSNGTYQHCRKGNGQTKSLVEELLEREKRLASRGRMATGEYRTNSVLERMVRFVSIAILGCCSDPSLPEAEIK